METTSHGDPESIRAGLSLAWLAGAVATEAGALCALASWRDARSLVGVLAIALPLVVLAGTLVIAAAARRRAGEMRAVLDEQTRELASLCRPTPAAGERDTRGDLVRALRRIAQGPQPVDVGLPPTQRPLAALLRRFSESLAAGRWAGPFDPRRELEGVWPTGTLMAFATAAVALGLIGTCFRFIVQVAQAEAFVGVFGESPGVAFLVAAVTTLQGFLTAGFVRRLQSDVDAEAHDVADRIDSFFKLQLFPHIVNPALSPERGIERGVERLETTLSNHIEQLSTQLPDWVAKGVSPSVHRLVETIDAKVTPLAQQLNVALQEFRGSFDGVGEVASTLALQVGRTAALVKAAVSAVNDAHRAPDEVSAVLRAAGQELDGARRGFAAYAVLARDSCAALTEASEKVAAAAAALNEREIGAARVVASLEMQTEAIHARTERIQDAATRLAQILFRAHAGLPRPSESGNNGISTRSPSETDGEDDQ